MGYFDYEFEYFPERGLQDLETLESEGCVFAQFWFEEFDEFRYCRVPFKPPEIVEYVEAAKAYEEYLHYTDSGCSGREALNKISNSKARERVIEDPRVDTQRESFSFANFMTADLESLTSGHEKERYHLVDENRSLDNRAILRKVTQNLETSVHALQNRYGNRPPFEINDEQDIHDLLYAIIKPIFLDTRTEEYTPKHAGSSKRVDIVIP